MRKHGALGPLKDQPNPAWVKRYKKRKSKNKLARKSRKKNR